MPQPAEDNRIMVLGIGNDILMDDGIGIRVVHALKQDPYPPHVTFQTAILGGLEILELVRDFDTVIFIDALKTGTHTPGTVLYFTPADFEETLHLSNLHDIDFLTALELGRRTGLKIPSNIYIIGVEIVEDHIFGTGFSMQIMDKYPSILQEISQRLREILAL